MKSLKGLGHLAYKLALPPELSWIDNVFHVSLLQRYISDPSHVIKDSEIEITDNLSYVKKPVKIVDYRVKQLWKREIPMVKVLWKNHSVEEATWETEEKMRRDYPHLFREDKIPF